MRKVKDLDRKNMVRVELTEKGDETYWRSLEKTGVLLDIFSCLSSDELAELEKYLLRLRSRAIKKLGLKRSLTNSLLHPPLDGLTTV